MSRKQYSKELKLELVKKHLEDGISYWKLGKEYGIEASIIRRWGHKYETFGEDGLEKQNADLCNYSAEFKKKIVLEYLGGNITSQDLAAKYKIHAPSTVRTWIKQYNNHEDLTNSRKEGVYLMAKNGARKNTTLISQSNGKWVFCKHKERDTYEVPGGHREAGEDILETAKRELQERLGLSNLR